jgi:hypothetical protein
MVGLIHENKGDRNVKTMCYKQSSLKFDLLLYLRYRIVIAPSQYIIKSIVFRSWKCLILEVFRYRPIGDQQVGR